MGDNVNVLGLRIMVESVTEHFNCPVCMHRLCSTKMTPCGHRFCDRCILEWINIRHTCPCCNAPLTRTQLIKDPQFDSLIDTVRKEESRAESIYFDTLISAAAAAAAAPAALNTTDEKMNGSAMLVDEDISSQTTSTDLRQLFSPVEQVLKEHLRRSLAAHEKFYQDLKRDHSRRQSEISAEHSLSLDRLSTNGLLTPDEITQHKTIIDEETRQKTCSLTENMKHCTKLVAEAYDRYLSDHIPELSILPVTVSVSLLTKSRRISDIVLNPNDSTEDLERVVREHMKQNGDDVVEFGDDVRFLSFSPFYKQSLYEMLQTARDVIEGGAVNLDITLLPKNCRPVIQFSIRPGSEIAIYGTVKCQSDIPKQCFVSTYREGAANNTMDYFHCKNCAAKWICRPCMDVCHKDHEVVPHIMNHKPTWACCYCPKKKKVPTATLR